MNSKSLLVGLTIGLLSSQAVANITPVKHLNLEDVTSSKEIRFNSEKALRNFMDQRKKDQIESRLDKVERKIAQKDSHLALRTPF